MRILIKKIIRIILKILLALGVLIISFYIFFYLNQERFFFNPKFLEKDYVYHFDGTYEELNIVVEDNISLNALLFKTDTLRKGVILYFHGNAGAIHEWGQRASIYTNNNYDILFIDYRGYGKSDGFYTSENQLYNDAQKVYDLLKNRYKEDEIVVLGFSLGSGLASYVASKNSPKLLILEAPYYAWNESISNIAPVPKWMINYEIPSYKFLANVKCPVTIFYGSKDFLIDPNKNAKPLKDLYPVKIDISAIIGAGHNGIYITKQYYDELKILLKN